MTSDCPDPSSPAQATTAAPPATSSRLNIALAPICAGTGRQHLLLAIDQVAGIEARDFKAVPVSNGVRRTSLHAISAKNTSVVIDVVDLGVAFGAAHPVLGSILRSLNINAVRGTGGGAQEAGYTLFQAIFVTLQHVHTAEALLKHGALQRSRPVGIILHNGRLEHLHKGDAHTFSDGRNILQVLAYSSIPKAAHSATLIERAPTPTLVILTC